MTSDDASTQPEETVGIVIAHDELSAEITVQGRTQAVHGGNAKETRRAALEYATGYATHIGRPVLIEARDAFSVQRLRAFPGGVVRGLTETPPPDPIGRARRGKRTLVIIAGALAAIMVAVVGIAVVQTRSPAPVAREGAGGAEAVPFDARPAPPGFSTEAVWRIPLASGTRPAVAGDGTRVAFVGADGRLAVAAPDGERLWADDLPLATGDIQGALRFVAGPDGPRVVVTGPSALWIWPADGGDPEEYELPDRAKVTFAGTAPLIAADEKIMLAEAGALVPVTLPQGTGGMLAHDSAVLTAEAKGPWFWVTPEGTPRKVSAARPAGADTLDRVLTASENYVVVRWTGKEDDHVVLAVHDADDGSVFASTVITAGELANARWVEGSAVAAYGPVLVDLESGESRVLLGFDPLSAITDTLYGELGDDQVAVGADGDPIRMAQDAARPWGLLDGRAVVLADNNLYALSPE